jgi:hypothetical protein
MSFIVGPTTWWVRSKESVDYYARICPIGTVLQDGSAIYCKAGGLAWIVAPNCTQVGSQWAGGQYNNTLIGTFKNICCVCEWPLVCTALINNGFNPCDWFIPDQTTLFNAYNCRSNWDTCSSIYYWSSGEINASIACIVRFQYNDQFSSLKSITNSVRSVRCIQT